MITISPPGQVTSTYPPPVSQGIFSLNLMAKVEGKMALKALIQIPVGFGALVLNVKTYPFLVFATPMHRSLPPPTFITSRLISYTGVCFLLQRITVFG
jgi:hypothetical protein